MTKRVENILFAQSVDHCYRQNGLRKVFEAEWAERMKGSHNFLKESWCKNPWVKAIASLTDKELEEARAYYLERDNEYEMAFYHGEL